jgi:hypothetical protein
MTTNKLEKLKAQRNEIDRKIREAAATQSAADREADKRRKIIIGGWILKHRPQLVRQLIANGLDREQDKVAFAGWAPPEQAPKLAPAFPSPGGASATTPQVQQEN